MAKCATVSLSYAPAVDLGDGDRQANTGDISVSSDPDGELCVTVGHYGRGEVVVYIAGAEELSDDDGDLAEVGKTRRCTQRRRSCSSRWWARRRT